MRNYSQNRREWLKRSAVLTGSLLTTLSIPALSLKPAFGMTPYKGTYSLTEPYYISPQAMEEIKARLSANENPWGPSKKAVQAIADAAAKGNRYRSEGTRLNSSHV